MSRTSTRIPRAAAGADPRSKRRAGGGRSRKGIIEPAGPISATLDLLRAKRAKLDEVISALENLSTL